MRFFNNKFDNLKIDFCNLLNSFYRVEDFRPMNYVVKKTTSPDFCILDKSSKKEIATSCKNEKIRDVYFTHFYKSSNIEQFTRYYDSKDNHILFSNNRYRSGYISPIVLNDLKHYFNVSEQLRFYYDQNKIINFIYLKIIMQPKDLGVIHNGQGAVQHNLHICMDKNFSIFSVKHESFDTSLTSGHILGGDEKPNNFDIEKFCLLVWLKKIIDYEDVKSLLPEAAVFDNWDFNNFDYTAYNFTASDFDDRVQVARIIVY